MKLSEAIKKRADIACATQEQKDAVISILTKAGVKPQYETKDNHNIIWIMMSDGYPIFCDHRVSSGSELVHAYDFIKSNQ